MDTALLHLKKAVAQSEHYVRARNLLALCYMEQRQFPRAAQLLRESEQLDREDPMLPYLRQLYRTPKEEWEEQPGRQRGGRGRERTAGSDGGDSGGRKASDLRQQSQEVGTDAPAAECLDYTVFALCSGNGSRSDVHGIFNHASPDEYTSAGAK